MTNTILELGKSLFKIEFMSDVAYLDGIIDDKYIEIGKSGKVFNKKDEINALSAETKDRNIAIYNFACEQLDENVYLVHYITQSGKDKLYRTSLWIRERNTIKIRFHQASLYKENVDLIAC